MEGTVKISLKDYNELRDFKNGIENGNTIVVFDVRRGTGIYVSTNDTVKELAEMNSGLVEEMNNKEKKLKKMSIWEFRRWKKEVHQS
jgi:hypothetical protein